MKAAVFHAPDVMRLEAVADPQMATGDMMIRMRASAVCGTDIRIWRGRKTRGVRRPSILGHEFVGEIVETGGHPGWRMGERVAPCPALPCGECRECRAGAGNVCSSLTAFGYEVDGSFAELIRIPRAFVEAGYVFRLADGVVSEHAALAEPLACVINGQDMACVKAGDTVAVLGTGPIGLLHIMLARHKGAKKVLAVQRSAHRRQAALDLGADLAVSAAEAEGIEADVSIVAVGSVDLANLALRMTKPRGRINLFAGFPAGVPADFDLNTLHYAEHHVTGAFGLTREHFAKALQLISDGKLPAGKLISHRLPLDRAIDAFALAEQGSALKVVVTP
jgi:L-iditol 2-dehydrogenase